MDVVLAVSELAMASDVAWEDWVMSCCWVGSVAMSQMVRSEKTGEGHKNGCISETVCLIELKLGQNVPQVWL